VTTPGYFEIYPEARPGLPAGGYLASTTSAVSAAPPNGADGTIPVDGTQFRLLIDAPRYVMPPDQILSTFPPAGSQGDWRDRLPQIVLKRRTLPWERNPAPGQLPETAPPWLALVVLAEGEGLLSPGLDVSQCVTPGVDLGPDADVAQGQYLEVSRDVIAGVFPCQDELGLLCHVRRVDLSDTELALGDDDGYLAVVLANRLPQPAPPTAPGGDPLPRKYTAYLINLERQIPSLLATEPDPAPQFDPTLVLADQRYLATAPDATLDQIAMQIGPGAPGVATAPGTGLVPFGTGRGPETAAGSWATGPAPASTRASADLSAAAGFKTGLVQGTVVPAPDRLRFPVLVSWDFTCTGAGGFGQLMHCLDVGLLGTLGAGQPPPVPEVALTGHVTLPQRTRHGDPAHCWYRGPFSPQPTVRAEPVNGVLPVAHNSDQLRKVVPDGREDLSQAALFEIGRLLALSKPTLVAALMDWRRELFGAARARELADLLAGELIAGVGTGVIGGRVSLETLIRTHIVGAFTSASPAALVPVGREVTAARVPGDLAGLTAEAVLAGLGADPAAAQTAARASGPEGLGTLPVPVAAPATGPVSRDQAALSRLGSYLAGRVTQLTVDALKIAPPAPAGPGSPVTSAPGRTPDKLDQLIGEPARPSRPPRRTQSPRRPRPPGERR
jgi:hypothetical protein